VDAEYGSFTGGIINVVTKSGTNNFHGNLFEFFRNTHLDARNYFSPERAVFHQNQYGGTIGGPIRKENIFFFADYQGQRYIQGIETGFVPSLANRSGDFGSASAFTGMVNGPYLAQVLSQRLGQRVIQGESFALVFPNGIIFQSAWGAAPTRMLQYIPKPNVGVNQFRPGPTSAASTTIRQRAAWTSIRNASARLLSTTSTIATTSMTRTPADAAAKHSEDVEILRWHAPNSCLSCIAADEELHIIKFSPYFGCTCQLRMRKNLKSVRVGHGRFSITEAVGSSAI
jgi:hypothetical protein